MKRKKRLLALTLCLVMVFSMLPAFQLPARAAAGGNISNVDVDTLTALGFANVDPAALAATAASQGSPVGDHYMSLFTVNELLVGSPDYTRLYEPPGVAENKLPLNGSYATRQTVGYNSVITSTRSVAFDPDGDGRDNHAAYISADVYTDDDKTNLRLVIQDLDSNTSYDKWIIATLPFRIYMLHIGCVMAIEAGDYDGDGKDEIAVFVPGYKDNHIRFYEVSFDANGKVTEATENNSYRVPLNDTTTGMYFHNYEDKPDKDRKKHQGYPAVSLATVTGTGDGADDLVIGVSKARHEDKDSEAFRLSSVVFVQNPMTSNKRLNHEALYDYWNEKYTVTDANDKKESYRESMIFPGVASGDINGDGKPDVVVAGYRMDEKSYWNDDWNVDEDRFLITWYSMTNETNEDGSQKLDDNNRPLSKYEKMTPMQWILTDDRAIDSKIYGESIRLRDSFDETSNTNANMVYNPVVVETFAERGQSYGDSVFVGGVVVALGPGMDVQGETDNVGSSTMDHAPQRNKAPRLICSATPFKVRYAAPLRAMDDMYSGTNAIDDRTVIEATAGNFDGNTLGREQIAFTYMQQHIYPITTTVHASTDKASYSTFVCTMGMTAVPGSEVNNKTYSKPSYNSTGINKLDSLMTNVDFEFMRLRQKDRYSRATVCAVDTDRDSIIQKPSGKDNDYYFSDPRIIAVLQAAPYFADLADGNTADSGGHSGEPETSLTISESRTTSTEQAVNFSAGGSVGLSIGVGGGTGIVNLDLLDLSAVINYSLSAGWNFEYAKERSFETTFTAGYDDAVALMMTPYIRHHYEVWDPGTGRWEDSWIDMPEEPQTTTMFVDYYDSVAGAMGWTTLRDHPQVLNNSQPGYPETYRYAPPGGVEWSNSKGEKETAVGFVSVGYGGSSMTKGIAVGESHTNGVTWGASAGAEVDLTVLFVTGSVDFTAEYTGGVAWGTSESMGMSGSVPNVYDIGKYGFQWDFGTYVVEDFPVTPGLGSGAACEQDLLVLSYLVKGVKSPPRPPIDGEVDSVTKDSVTITWSDGVNRRPERYEIARYINGYYYSLGTVPSSRADENGVYTFTENDLMEGTAYTYRIRTWGYANGMLSASGWSSDITAITNLEGAALLSIGGETTCPPGQSTTFTATLSDGCVNPQFEWQVKQGGVGKWMTLKDSSTVSGATTPELTLSNVTSASHGNIYRCAVATMVTGSASVQFPTSNELTLSVSNYKTETTLTVTHTPVDENDPDSATSGRPDETITTSGDLTENRYYPVTATQASDEYELMQHVETTTNNETPPVTTTTTTFYLRKVDTATDPATITYYQLANTDQEAIDGQLTALQEAIDAEDPKVEPPTTTLEITLTAAPTEITSKQEFYSIYTEATEDEPAKLENPVTTLDDVQEAMSGDPTEVTNAAITFAAGFAPDVYYTYAVGSTTVYAALDDLTTRYFTENSTTPSTYDEIFLGPIVWLANTAELTDFAPSVLQAVEARKTITIPGTGTPTTELTEGTELALTAKVTRSTADGASVTTRRVSFLIRNTTTGETETVNVNLNNAGTATTTWRAKTAGEYDIRAKYNSYSYYNESISDKHKYTASYQQASMLVIDLPDELYYGEYDKKYNDGYVGWDLKAYFQTPDGTIEADANKLTFKREGSSGPFTIDGNRLISIYGYGANSVTVTATYTNPATSEVFTAKKKITLTPKPVTISVAGADKDGIIALNVGGDFTPEINYSLVMSGDNTACENEFITARKGNDETVVVSLSHADPWVASSSYYNQGMIKLPLYTVSLELPEGVSSADKLPIGEYPIRIVPLTYETINDFYDLVEEAVNAIPNGSNNPDWQFTRGKFEAAYPYIEEYSDARYESWFISETARRLCWIVDEFTRAYNIIVEDAVLRVTAPSKKVTYSLDEVNALKGSLSASVSYGVGQTISSPINSGEEVYVDSNVTFRAYPDRGYAVDTWNLNVDPASASASDSRSVVVPEGNDPEVVSASVTFKEQKFKLNFNAVAPLETAELAELKAKYNNNSGDELNLDEQPADLFAQQAIYFKVTPPPGQAVEKWTVNDVTVQNDAGGNLIDEAYTLPRLMEDTTVKVHFAEAQSLSYHKVEISAVAFSGNGTVIPLDETLAKVSHDAVLNNASQARANTEVNFTAWANDGRGYRVNRWERWEIDEETPEGKWKAFQGLNTDKHKLNLDGDVKLRVVFENATMRKVTFAGNAHGTVTAASGGADLTSGDFFPDFIPISFTATPNQNCVVDKWTVNNSISTGDVRSYEINPLRATTNVVVNFIETFKVTVAPTTGGTITVKNGEDVLNEGETVLTDGTLLTLTAEAEEGYQFINWIIGNDTTKTNPTTTHIVNGDVTISAKFLKEHTVTVRQTTGGTITVKDGLNNLDNGANTVLHGTTLTLSATPNADYEFTSWNIGGDTTDENNPTTHTVDGDATISARFTSTSPGGGGMAGGGGSDESKTGVVIVDGEEYEIVTETEEDGVIVAEAEQEGLTECIAGANNESSVIFPITDSPSVRASLVVKNIEDMAEKDMTLIVSSGPVSYEMPAVAVDTEAILSALGATDSSKVKFAVGINRLPPQTTVNLESGTLMLPPVEFTVTATYNGKTVEVKVFEKYVRRVIEIPDGVDASKITTAVVVENGAERHVPTKVYEQNGKWYALVSSLTDSVYALIHNEQSFTDADGKWFADVVKEMAGRKIINGRGDGTFDGEAGITRAEFAAIIVRALGLPENGDASAFTDVSRGAWYYGAVGKAFEYKLIEGKGDGIFSPGEQISRQDAMLMIQRAAGIAEYPMDLLNARDLTAEFTDLDTVSEYASEAMYWNIFNNFIAGSDGLVRPRDNITRAETATIVLRLLQKSCLVDVRSVA